MVGFQDSLTSPRPGQNNRAEAPCQEMLMSTLPVDEKQSKIAASIEELQSEVEVANYKFDNGGSPPHSKKDIYDSARWIAERNGLTDDDGKVPQEVIEAIVQGSNTV